MPKAQRGAGLDFDKTQRLRFKGDDINFAKRGTDIVFQNRITEFLQICGRKGFPALTKLFVCARNVFYPP
jgi:hypothetical protein